MKGHVHADILAMAQTKEKRERIKWYHARGVFFVTRGNQSALADGLTLAHECEHPDARFLVSLFPRGPPNTAAEAEAVFLSNSEDARCLCWAVQCGAGPRHELMERAASGGYAWAHAWLGYGRGDVRLEMAASLGEPSAMFMLYDQLKSSADRAEQKRAMDLLEESSLLGLALAQRAFAHSFEGLPSFDWLRRSAIQGRGSIADNAALRDLVFYAGKVLKKFDAAVPSEEEVVAPYEREEQEWAQRIVELRDQSHPGVREVERLDAEENLHRGWAICRARKEYELELLQSLQNDRYVSGLAVNEIGLALASVSRWEAAAHSETELVEGERAIWLHKEWRDNAIRGVRCWMWAARELGLITDMRIMIADAVWKDRVAWIAPLEAVDNRCGKRARH